MGAIQSLVAASKRLIVPKGRTSQNATDGRASLAWDLWEETPEVGSLADYIGHACSNAQLTAGVRLADGTIGRAPDNSRAAQLVAAIAGGPEGQSTMLGDVGRQMTVAGELWTLVIPDEKSDDLADDRWITLSTEEVKVQRGGLKAMVDGEEVDVPAYDPDSPDETLPIAFRAWNPSPRKHHLATSSVIRSVTVLEELRILNAAVAAIARSRITGRGVLLVPAGARFPGPPGTDGAQDSLLDTFIEVASTAIREPESAAATVPIVLEIPGDLISGVQWLQFSSDFDAIAIQLRDEAIRRFAVGSDVPAEVLLGLSQGNHWSAWAITAEAIRLGVEPKLGLFCQALTVNWLRPILEAEGDPDADSFLVWYDTAALRTSSNKAAAALDAFNAGLIDGEAARRELGFTEADAPTATKAAAPPKEGSQLPVADTQAPPAEPAFTASATLDSFTAGTDAALAEAVDGLVWAALAVAGRKLMQTPAVPRMARTAARELAASASVHTVHPVQNPIDVEAWHLLDGAWDRAPAIAARYGVDPLALTAALDGYVNALLTTGTGHDFDNVPRLLAQMRVHASAARQEGV